MFGGVVVERCRMRDGMAPRVALKDMSSKISRAGWIRGVEGDCGAMRRLMDLGSFFLLWMNTRTANKCKAVCYRSSIRRRKTKRLIDTWIAWAMRIAKGVRYVNERQGRDFPRARRRVWWWLWSADRRRGGEKLRLNSFQTSRRRRRKDTALADGEGVMGMR